MVDIKAKAQEIITKVQNDKDFAAKFEKDPCKAIESVIGVDLPDDQVNEIVKAVKAKVTVDNLSKLGASIFGKK